MSKAKLRAFSENISTGGSRGVKSFQFEPRWISTERERRKVIDRFPGILKAPKVTYGPMFWAKINKIKQDYNVSDAQINTAFRKASVKDPLSVLEGKIIANWPQINRGMIIIKSDASERNVITRGSNYHPKVGWY